MPAWLIGAGLAVFPIHNAAQPFIEYAFLPVVGLSLIVLGMAGYALHAKEWPELGSPYVWIPLAVIAASMVAQIAVTGIEKGGATALMGIMLFALYVVSRKLGSKLFLPFAIMSMIASLGVVAQVIADGGIRTGGVIFGENYEIATGFIALGALVARGKYQWLVVLIDAIGLLFTGSPEALIVIAIVGLVILIRRDWSRKLAITGSAIVLAMTILFVSGVGVDLWRYSAYQVTSVLSQLTNGAVQSPPMDSFFPHNTMLDAGGRIPLMWAAISNMTWLGHGYELTVYTASTVHNVPLIVVDQIGPIAGLAWLFLMVWVTVKTSWKYACIGIIAMCLFDHYIYDQLGPMWWAIVGVSTTVMAGEKDLIFRDNS